MIKVHDKLWYVVRADDEDSLAYMTHYKEDQAFEKRKRTGLGWVTRKDEKVPENICDNTPQKGLYIGSSVSRWSTSNKLFRVKDPRGFTVEVPTDNIATLLHLTTVVNGVIQEECVWGKEGNNHILLPVNSEPYLQAKKNMEVLESPTIKIKDVPYGSKVMLLNDDTIYTFLGRGKPTYTIKPYTLHYEGWGRGYSKRYHQEYEYTPKGYTNIFSYPISWDKERPFRHETKSNPKIVEVVENGDGSMFNGDLEIYPNSVPDGCNYYNSTVKSVQWKEVKK